MTEEILINIGQNIILPSVKKGIEAIIKKGFLHK